MDDISNNEIQEILKEEALQQRIDNSKQKDFNWFKEDEKYFDNWEKIKAYLAGLFNKTEKLFIWGHSRDKITGKPQLIFETRQKIPLVIKVEKTNDKGVKSYSYRFIDDRYDRRYDGYEINSYSDNFYVYKVIDDDIEYAVFSKNKLDPVVYTFSGMVIEMSTGSEITKSLKIRSLSNIFFSREEHPTVQVLPKRELVQLVRHLQRKLKLNKRAFTELVFLRPDGKVYLHSADYNLLRLAQLLSAKYDQYPLHVANIGVMAKGKTYELEALDYKFREREGICEAGSSTPKKLVPSFKETIVKPGYILDCNRIALIDELMKMILNANAGTRSEELVRGALGQLNMLLEHKKRTVGSGNNSLVAMATAKCLFSMNPYPGKNYLEDHIKILDETTMSRMFWFVIDETEIKFIDSNKPYKWGHKAKTIFTKGDRLYSYKGVPTDIFFTIYDSCQSFLSRMDMEKVRRIFKDSLGQVSEPFKSIWKGRGLHHCILLLDGIIKVRVLFSSRPPGYSFTACNGDYKSLEKLLDRIVPGWSTYMKQTKEN